MRLGRSSAYGVLAVVFLASPREAGDAAQVDQIAEATQIPREYLRKLLARLLHAGLVRSVRGRNGGYRLARAAKSITMLDVIEAVEGPINEEAIIEEDLIAPPKPKPARGRRSASATASPPRSARTQNLRRWRETTTHHVRELLAKTTIAQMVEK